MTVHPSCWAFLFARDTLTTERHPLWVMENCPMSATIAEPTTDPNATDPQTTTASATGTNGASGQEEPRITQSELNRILADERRKAAEKAQRDRDKAERDAEEKRLSEAQEYRTLWEKSNERIRDLETQAAEVETLTQRATRAEEAVAELVKAELEDAPEYIKDAIRDRDPVGKLDFIRKHRGEWGRTRPNGDGPLPRPTNNVNLSRDELIAQEYDAQRRRGR